MNFEVIDFPWSHGYSESFVDDEFAKKMNKEFPKWDSPIWDKWGKVFDTEYGYKKMLTDKFIMSVMTPTIRSFIEQLESPEFISTVSEATGIDDLLIDDELYGGGLFLHPTDSHLTTHVDFNFNNDIKLYRAVNLLYYMSDDCEGGDFELYDTDLQKQKSVPPKLNTCILFATNNKTYHGVNKVISGYRKLLSLWYYTKEPTKDLSEQPHRTLWVK